MMKKFMFFALASVAMLASCSSDDTIAVDEANVAQAQDGPVAIQLGLGQVSITRGTGTVGGTTAALNKWQQQKFNVFMLKHRTMDFAEDVNGDIYNDTEFKAPDNALEGRATDVSNAVKYYPATGRYEFWGYRLDGAEGINDYVWAADKITRDFKIDGSQDIMVAWADTAGIDKAFSAYAARRGNHPILSFRHLLSRLHFRVEAGNESSAELNPLVDDPAATTAVVVDSIKVIGLTEGTLTIAHLGDDDAYDRIAWTAGTEDSLTLKARTGADAADLTDLTPVILRGSVDGVTGGFTPAADQNVGEALLVAPADTYKLIVFVSQRVTTDGGTTFQKRVDKIEADLTGGFLKNNSYEVNVKVYGLEEIKVNVTLEPWVEGTAISIDPEGL